MENYYEILGVSETATQDEIKKAYRKLSKQYHPDVNPQGEEMFKKVSEAYENIGDETKRQQYEHKRKNPFGGGMGFDIHSMFEQMMNGNRSQRHHKAPDKLVELNITTFESYFGVEKEIHYDFYQSCKPCNGSGGDKRICPSCNGQGYVMKKMGSGMFQQIFNATCDNCGGEGYQIIKKCNSCGGIGLSKGVERLKVSIPKNVDNGDFMRVATKGDFNRNTMTRGDLILKVNLVKNDNFEKVGMDLVYYLTISALDIVTKDKLQFPHPDGALSISMPNKLSSDKPLRMIKKGFRNGTGSGDFYVKLNITNDFSIDETTKNKIQELLKQT